MNTPRSSEASSDAVLVTLTLNRYRGGRRALGFLRMGSDRLALRRVPGLRFFRLMGTGRGSDLTLGADLGRWARFAVWPERADFERFEASALRRAELRLAFESYTALLRPLSWHGTWSGGDPFASAPRAEPAPGQPVAALTRATIRPRVLRAFWTAVPQTQRDLREAPGLLATIGLGEAPLRDQATFSVWQDAASLHAFAYGHGAHRQVIARTRREGWYREELFARFAVLETFGTWDGRDPLAHPLAPT